MVGLKPGAHGFAALTVASRLLPLALVTVLSVALFAGCSSGGQGRSNAPTDPSTEAQINARLLARGTAPGFNEVRAPGVAERSAHVRPFAPPAGSLNTVCSKLASPELFRPAGLLDTGEGIVVANPKRYGELPPNWVEGIDVYPGTEAEGLVTTLAALIGRCGHFQFVAAGAGAEPAPATEVAAPMRGLGTAALYVTVRVAIQPGAFQVLDWVLIRADRTVIWIADQSSASRSGTGRDALTLRLAQDAWRHYRAA